MIGKGGMGEQDDLPNMFTGAGVIGLGEVGSTVPDPADTRQVGVYGMGEPGVKGVGIGNARGGVFQSHPNTAQIRLVPQRQDTEEPTLPRVGLIGDLLLLVNAARKQDEQGNIIKEDRCSLWLCVPAPGGILVKNAFWQEVQLGSPVKGTL